MPEIADVIPGEPVESDWGNLIRSRTLQRYASESIRDSSIPSPVGGDLAYIEDIAALQVHDGTSWILVEMGGELTFDDGDPTILDGTPVRRIGLFSTYSYWSAVNSFLRLRIGGDTTTSYLMRLYDRAGAEDPIYSFTESGIVGPTLNAAVAEYGATANHSEILADLLSRIQALEA